MDREVKNHGTVLIVEDCEEDYRVLADALRRSGVTNPLHRSGDCASALEWLLRPAVSASTPASLVLLDLNLPDAHGSELLCTIRGHSNIALVPVVIYTTGANPSMVRQCYALGANSYVVKALGLEAIEEFATLLGHWWLNTVELPPSGG